MRDAAKGKKGEHMEHHMRPKREEEEGEREEEEMKGGVGKQRGREEGGREK